MINAAKAPPEKHSLTAHAALLGMAVIWGVNFTVSKLALERMSPLAFNSLRFPIAALLLYVVLRRSGRIPSPDRGDWPRLIMLGIFGNLVYQLCFIFGLDRTTASNASLLLAGTPIVTALFSAAVGHERVQARVWFGVVATIAGIGLIVLSTARSAHAGTISGDLFMIGAILMWAFYTVAGRPLVERYGAVPVTAWSLWVATAGLFVAGIPELLRMNLSAISVATWGAVFYAGALSIGLAYIFFYHGVSELGSTRAASYSNIVPVFALLSAWIWLGQTPTLVQLTGAAVIIGGVTIAQSGAPARAAYGSPEA